MDPRRAFPRKVRRFHADTFQKESDERWRQEMMVVGGDKRGEILAAAGLRDCINCHHTTMHFVLGDGEQLHAVEDSGPDRAKLLVCDVCRYVYPPENQEPLESHEQDPAALAPR